MNRNKLGLIVNPLAGIGGSVGLKGSDGAQVQARARMLGAQPHAGERAAAALQPLMPLRGQFDLLCAPGEMGEAAARAQGFESQVLGSILPGQTTAADTARIAREMQAAGAELLLFAGGDGTARDISHAVGLDLPALGIPAGVKIHSAAFAVNPRSAGELAADFLRGRARLVEAEVVDLDEDAYRRGEISTRLYGYLRAPGGPRAQNRKAPTPASDAVQAGAIAEAVVERMDPGQVVILGPGTTTRAIAGRLGLPKTLVGVDVVTRESVLLQDASERQILDLLASCAGSSQVKILVTPVGGQGFLFGRGNQQISPAVIRAVGRENILIVSLPGKLAALRGQPLRVDTGDPALDVLLAGYYTIITGYSERSVYRVEG